MKFGYEELSENLIERLMPLITENWQETGHFERLNIFWEMYLAAGTHCFLLETDDNDLVGAMLLYAGPYPHDRETKYAEQLTFYIKPGYRKHSETMMAGVEDYMKSIGVELLIQSAPIDSRFSDHLEKLDYQPLETRFYKRLN